MGYGLPAAIGSAISNKNKRIICFEGDGSLQMNIQELATISEYNLNILLFVISNDGYHSIRQTQNNYFSDNLIGIDSTTGLSFPDLKLISQSYNLDYLKVENNNFKKFLNDFNKIKLPLVVELKVDKNINFQPRVKSRKDSSGNIVSSNLFDMHPYIDDEEMKNILAIKILNIYLLYILTTKAVKKMLLSQLIFEKDKTTMQVTQYCQKIFCLKTIPYLLIVPKQVLNFLKIVIYFS